MKNARIIEVILGFIIIAVCIGAMVSFFKQGGKDGGPTYILKGEFDRIEGIKTGSDVRIAGVKVGKVASIRLNNETYVAVVEMELFQDVKVPSDSSAEVASESLIGGRYINVTAGGSTDMLKNGEKFDYTQSSVNIESLVSKYVFGGHNSSKVSESDNGVATEDDGGEGEERNASAAN